MNPFETINDWLAFRWQEIGRRIIPTRHKLFVVTEPIPQVTDSGLILPNSQTSFYEGMLHMRAVTARVLAVGQDVRDINPGERIVFQRKFFVPYCTLPDLTRAGWINEREITLALEEGTIVGRELTYPEGKKAIRERPM